VGRQNPNVWAVSYQHPASFVRSAVRLVVYMWRRPEDKRNAGASSRWGTLPRERRLGDARAFIRAANGRTREIREDAETRGKDLSKNKAPWCCSFVHLVLSPSNRAELPDEALCRLADPWIRDACSRVMPHVGAVHREGGGHLHLAIVRDKFSKDELRVLKERADGLAMALGRTLDREGLGLTQETPRRREAALGLERGMEMEA
jgi:hypothetical protein